VRCLTEDIRESGYVAGGSALALRANSRRLRRGKEMISVVYGTNRYREEQTSKHRGFRIHHAKRFVRGVPSQSRELCTDRLPWGHPAQHEAAPVSPERSA
jgi:hypothetical protein